MTERAALLGSLVRLEAPVENLVARLSVLGWDSDREVVTLTRAHAVSVLRRFLAEECAGAEVEAWANAIEGRDDIGLEAGTAGVLRELVFELANPTLTRELTCSSAGQWLLRLQGW